MRRTLCSIIVCLAAVISVPASASDITSLQGNRYVIDYPQGWKVHDNKSGTIVFKHKIPNSKSSSTINIQTIYTKAAGGKYKDVKALMDDFLIQVPMHTKAAKLFDREPFVLKESNGTTLAGEQIKVTFEEGKQVFKQWQIMLETSDGVLFQAFAYRAPIQFYDVNLPVAEAMLASWSIK